MDMVWILTKSWFHLILVKLMDTAISNHVMFCSHSSSFDSLVCRAVSGVNSYWKMVRHSNVGGAPIKICKTNGKALCVQIKWSSNGNKTAIW